MGFTLLLMGLGCLSIASSFEKTLSSRLRLEIAEVDGISWTVRENGVVWYNELDGLQFADLGWGPWY